MDPPGKSPPRPGTLGRDPAPGRGPEGSLPDGFGIAAPAVSLPKGGGAIAGMGEKVSANPVTGSASVGIPLPHTPGRGGTLSPRAGDGFTTLDRGAFKALGVLNKFGPGARANEILRNMGITEEQTADALGVWQRLQ